MITQNTKLPSIVYKCRQHNQKAEAYCKAKFCSERLLCARCTHPHSENEPIDSLFSFLPILKRELPLDDSSLFVDRFLVSLSDIFHAIKMTEENLIWLHQMLISASENSRKAKASMQSLQLLHIQIANYFSQCKDVQQITDSKQFSDLIEWYLTLCSTIVPQARFDDRDCELMRTVNLEVTRLSQMLCEKVGFLAQKFHLMKGVGSVQKPESSESQISKLLKATTILQQQPSESLASTERHKSEQQHYQTQEKISKQEPQPIPQSIPHQHNKVEKIQQPKITVPKETKLVEKVPKVYPKKSKIKAEKKEANDDSNVMQIEDSNEDLELKKVDTSELRKVETIPKEKLEGLEKALAALEETPEKDANVEQEIQKLKEEIETAKELHKVGEKVTSKVETNPIKELKKEVSRILQELLKNTDASKTPASFLEPVFNHIEEKRQEVLSDFKEKLSEEEVRVLISKMKESKVDFKHDTSKLIEACLEYQLRWGKLASEVAALETKRKDFSSYQNTIEKFCRLRLMPPNYEKTINDYFDLKTAQVHFEYLMISLQKADLIHSLQKAYSADTNEIDAQMTFQRLQEISIERARLINQDITNLYQEHLIIGEGLEEFAETIAQSENLRRTLQQALKVYEENQHIDQLLAEAEKSLHSRLYFDEMAVLRPFGSKLVSRPIFFTVKAKRFAFKAGDSDDDNAEDGKEGRRNKRVKTDDNSHPAVRSSRTKAKVGEFSQQ